MQCPKCGQPNSETAQYCSRCHNPLHFRCPACGHVQTQGGKCEKCGVDFAKYAALLIFQAKTEAEKARKQTQRRTGLVKQILLLPVTGGLSLLHYFFRGGQNE